MTDNYEFSKSSYPQGVSTETPYVSKNWNFINDINGQSYSNNGLTLVQFDLSSIYNSTQLIDPSQMYMAIPITYVSAYNVSGTGLIAPVAASWASTGLKNGYFQMLHGADVVINGKTVEQFQPNLNAYITFKMLSQMSADDMATLGTSLGMGECLDKWESMVYNGSGTSTGGTAFPNSVPTGGVGGNGIVNNYPFTQTSISADGDQTLPGKQFVGTYNKGLYTRVKKIMDISSNGQNNMFGTSSTTNITQTSKLTQEFKSTYSVASTNYSTWTDVAIIRMCDVFDSFKQLPLMKKLDCTLRLYFNTGTVVSNVIGGTSTGYMVSSGSANTFTNTCPLIQCNLMTATGCLPAGATAIGSGLFIGGPTNCSLNLGTSATSVNLNQGQGHFMTSCRMYYPQITLKPEKLLQYIPENRAKKICYTSVLTNTFAGITAGSTGSFLVQSGVSSPRGLLIIPFVSSSVYGAAASMTTTVFSQMQSPFDTAPATNGPLSLTNLQVSIGGVNVLAQTISYGYEEFLQQVMIYEKINGADVGLSCGLINQAYWENGYRTYYVDVSRANIADLMTPRNVNITFTNNSNVTIDCLVFTEYFREIVLDVETGIVSGL